MYDSCLFDCREKGVSVSASPSPTEELEEDMPASSELASILKTLKRVEQNIKCKSANTCWSLIQSLSLVVLQYWFEKMVSFGYVSGGSHPRC